MSWVLKIVYKQIIITSTDALKQIIITSTNALKQIKINNDWIVFLHLRINPNHTPNPNVSLIYQAL